MPNIKVAGKVIEFPDDLSQEELLSQVKQAESQLTQKSFMIKKAWETAKIPMKKSAEGIRMVTEGVASMLPETGTTQSPALNTLIGTPRTAVESVGETTAKVAPEFIDPLALATAGIGKGASFAAKTAKGIKAIKGAEKTGLAITKGIEGLSGAQPGTIVEAVKDPLLIFKKGTKAVQELYESAKKGTKAPKYVKDLVTHTDVVEQAAKKLKTGTITVREAFDARKAVHALRKSKQFVTEKLDDLYKKFNEVVKTSKKFFKADKAFQKGLKVDSARTLWPRTASGKPSLFKSAAIPIIPGSALAFSPAAQAVVGAGVGLTGRLVGAAFKPGVVPTTAVVLEALKRLKRGK